MQQDFGIARRGEDGALVRQLAPQLRRVGEVAVVRDGERSAAIVDEERLGVGQHRAAGGGVPGVPDRDIAQAALDCRVVEVLRDQPHSTVCPSPAVLVDGDDAGALLATMLQGVEAQIREPCRVRYSGDSEDAAHCFGGPPWVRG